MFKSLVLEPDPVVDLETAMEYKMDRGKFKGQQLMDVICTRDGRQYLTWVHSLEDYDQYAKELIGLVLAYARERLEAQKGNAIKVF